jgi:hypothetical protein
MRIYSYDTYEYPFAAIVSNHLGCHDLAALHNGVTYPLFSREKDQSTAFHERFYAIGDAFHEVYRRFIRVVIANIVGQALVYQRIPTFRVHLPGNVAVGEFHRDRDYFHSPQEINFWLPLTKAWDTNTVWVESAEGKEDFRPVELKYGQFFMFDGANLKHGNKVNQTGVTRVSFDFRVVTFDKYQPNNRRTINTDKRFIIGEYFEKL